MRANDVIHIYHDFVIYLSDRDMPRRESIKAIVFDLDNTLLNRDRLVRCYLEHLYGERAEPLIAWDDRGRSDRLWFATNAIEWLGLVQSAESFWLRFRDELADSVQVDHQAIALLKRLSEDFEVGLLTYGAEASQRQKIRKMGIEGHLSAIGISGSMPWAKPDPRAFHHMCALLGVPAHKTLMVGDDLNGDVQGALQAGLQAVWISNETQNEISSIKSVYELEFWLSNHAVNS